MASRPALKATKSADWLRERRAKRRGDSTTRLASARGRTRAPWENCRCEARDRLQLCCSTIIMFKYFYVHVLRIMPPIAFLKVAQTLFGDGTHSDILAFTHDATVAMVAASRPSKVKEEAQRRVAAAKSGSAVWFKHMRKAGGSSVRAALEEAFYAQKKHAGARSSSSRSNATLDRRQPWQDDSEHRRLKRGVDDSTIFPGMHQRDVLLTHGRRLERSYEHKREKALAQTGGNEYGFTLHHQEFDLFPVKCLILEPRTVYITAIRQPVNRFISLFYYDGNICRLHAFFPLNSFFLVCC